MTTDSSDSIPLHRPSRSKSAGRILLLRVIGATAVFLAVATIAVLAKPEWREFFAEIAVVLGVLIIARVAMVGLRSRFRSEDLSPFAWALQRERASQKAPSQLVTAISMAALPDRSTFELLAAAVDRRLHERHGYGLDDERARNTVGPEVYDMLHVTRPSGLAANLPRRKRTFGARHLPAIARVLHRSGVSAGGSPNGRVNDRNESVEHVRTILNSLEKL